MLSEMIFMALSFQQFQSLDIQKTSKLLSLTLANGEDPGEMLQHAALHQDLHHLLSCSYLCTNDHGDNSMRIHSIIAK